MELLLGPHRYRRVHILCALSKCAYHLEHQPAEDGSISGEIHDHNHHKITCYPKNAKTTIRIIELVHKTNNLTSV